MAKVIAVHGGGDWADASAEYVIPPENMDVEKEYAEFLEQWSGKNPLYTSFSKWLKDRGAREPNKDELEIYPEDV